MSVQGTAFPAHLCVVCSGERLEEYGQSIHDGFNRTDCSLNITKKTEFLTLMGPCIVIYYYSKTNQMHHCIEFILFGMTLYMFRTVSASKQTAVSV